MRELGGVRAGDGWEFFWVLGGWGIRPEVPKVELDYGWRN